jgi:hypothetical protein
MLTAGALLACALSAGPTRAAAEAQAAPRLHVECSDGCDDAYLRQALSYFDWVRDRHDADLAISVVIQSGSNGGWKYTITLRRPQLPDAPSIVRTIPSRPDEQPASFREKLRDAMLQCLFEALRGTPHESMFTLGLPGRSEQMLRSVNDGWDHWVFSPALLAEVEGESAFYYMDLSAKLDISRVTDESKLLLETSFARHASRYDLEDDVVWSGHVDQLIQRALYAASIGAHWALGALAVVEHSEYDNRQFHVRGGPVAEWNLFPYADNASRQLRVAYQAGVGYTRYFELTVYDKMSEIRPYHALSLIVDVNQAWGSMQAIVQGRSLLDEPQRWRLTAGVALSLSLVAGFALELDVRGALIRDQIGLRGRELTDRELLLELLEFPTEVSFEGMFGFSYTFGSVHDTIVNPRFGRVEIESDE